MKIKLMLAMPTIVFFLIAFVGFAQKSVDSLSPQLKVFSDSIFRQEGSDGLKQACYEIQNRGFLLAENMNDYKSSLKSIDSALALWILLKDSANEANNRKFRGLLLAHLGHSEEGKAEIKTAVKLFVATNRLYGVQVCNFDMSKVLEIENNLNDALLEVNEAFDYWIRAKDTFRILVNGLQKLNLLIQLNKLRQSSALRNNIERNFNPEQAQGNIPIDFYILSICTYRSRSNWKKASRYYEIFTKRLINMQAHNIPLHSDYLKLLFVEKVR
jgi:hypothetical protein